MSSSSNALAAEVGFVKRGKNRNKVFLAVNGNRTPSEIAESVFGSRSATDLSIVSRALAELTDARLIALANPQDKTGRIYHYAPKGLKVREELAKYGG